MKNQFLLLFSFWIACHPFVYSQSAKPAEKPKPVEKSWNVDEDQGYDISVPGIYKIRLTNFGSSRKIMEGVNTVTTADNSFDVIIDTLNNVSYPGVGPKSFSGSISFACTDSDKQLRLTKIDDGSGKDKGKDVTKVKAADQYISFGSDMTAQTICANCASETSLDIIYDVSCNKIVFPVKERNKKFFLKMLPIDRVVQIVPINYNPYLDSIAVNVAFDDKNLESQALFSGLFTPQSGQQVKATDAKTEAKKEGDFQNAKASDRIPKLEKLKAELLEFRNAAIIATAIDVDKLTVAVNKMLGEVNQKFELKISSGAEFAKAYKVKYSPVIDDEAKLVDEVAVSLDKVIRFNRASVLPVQIENADISVFNFSSFKGGKKNGQFKYQFFNKNGFKIDFSTGLFTTGLIDEKYTFGADTTIISPTRSYIAFWNGKETVRKDSITGYTSTNQREILRDSRDKFNIGLGVLLHAYSRWGKRINVGLSVGGIIDNQTNIKYTGGGSVLLGREQRLILTYGIALGKVNKLGNGLQEGKFVTLSTNQAEPTMLAKWASSWFFGVTYNLGTLVSK
ncbi:hypothetical protein [Dyadobacter diqingensis]|uniref:hypothetical protein n=1 Tax=Dyadobacter diqingensis TaxID=2938121 RepID=UPI0020C573AE|nr:hypothetical protein [Dyadobacter diqingensis]